MSTTTTRILYTPANANILVAHRSWVWPLPRLDGLSPCIIETTLARPGPEGIALGYPMRSSSPDLVPVFAAQDGIVTYAGNGASGSTICIDHAGGWSSSYGELEHLLARPTDRFRRRRKERVRAGDVIGHAPRSILRIRFGLSRIADDECVEQDPAPWMPAWSMLPWFVEPTQRVATRAVV
jgi:hypothetical protein